jgi:hypothetical protein
MSRRLASEGGKQTSSIIATAMHYSESTWEVILMEFTIEFQLKVRRHDSIIVIVDTLTKSSHFFHL